MSSVLKLCAVLAILATAVLANPIIPQLNGTISEEPSNVDPVAGGENVQAEKADGENAPAEKAGGDNVTTEEENLAPDSSTPDALTPDASTPDASTPDASTPDASTPDASTPDASTLDTANAPSSESPDALSLNSQDTTSMMNPKILPSSTKVPTTKPKWYGKILTDQSTTAAPGGSSFTSPNIMSIAALMLMVIIKMCATY